MISDRRWGEAEVSGADHSLPGLQMKEWRVAVSYTNLCGPGGNFQYHLVPVVILLGVEDGVGGATGGRGGKCAAHNHERSVWQVRGCPLAARRLP